MGRRTDKNLVRLRGKKYFENFSVRGIRFRGSIGTDDEDTAQIIAAKTRSDALLGKIVDKKPEMTLDVACGRFLIENEQRHLWAARIRTVSPLFLKAFGKQTFLSAITNSALADYVTVRRVGRSNGTVNADLHLLRAMLKRAAKVWEVATPTLNWELLLLEYDDKRQQILGKTKQSVLLSKLRDDYKPIPRFGFATGLRLSNILGLKWSQINWEAGFIEVRLKSKKPGGKLHYVPISETVAAILNGERGNHPVYVFTYICHQDMHGTRRLKGHRYPVTAPGFYYHWNRARNEAGLGVGRRSRENFRFHDIRHTAATRALAKCGNLKTVQHLLGHENIQTTARYAATDLIQVQGAMEADDDDTN